ncbi:hypothetical protein BDW68DRAFT_183731 [Aspergillus falconensis]
MADVCKQLLLPEDPRHTIQVHGFVDIPVYEDFLGDGDLHQWVMDEVRVLAHHTCSQGSTCWAIQHSILQQILQGNPLNYLLNVLLQPYCKYRLYAHPQPVIRPALVAPTETPAPAKPFRLPVPLLQLALYENTLTSFVPLIIETARSCDHHMPATSAW